MPLMSKHFGYAILTLGCSAIVILWNIGNPIPLRELWYVLGFFVSTFGLYIVVKARFQEFHKPEDYLSKESQRLRASGEKIKMSLQNCEIKDRSYQKEISTTDEFGRKDLLDALYDSDRLSTTEEVRMTYIVFYKKYNNVPYKFISNGISSSAEELIRRIDTEPGINLYIDRFNPNKYFFDT